MNAPLAEKVAVVTGGSRGIGAKVAERLEQAGARVVRISRSAAGAGGIACDVRDAAAVERAAAGILREHGAPDILVTAAGSLLIKPLVETTAAEFAEQVATNLQGPFALLGAFVGAMVARRRGLIVTIGSVADHEAFPGNAAYGAAKHGLRGLVGVLRSELRGSGVRATLLSPGPVDTALWDAVDPDRRAGFTRRADMLKPDDVAEAVLWLATRPARVAVPEMQLEPVR